MLNVIKLLAMMVIFSNQLAWAAPSCPLQDGEFVAFNDLALYGNYEYLQEVNTNKVYVCKYQASMNADIVLNPHDIGIVDVSNPSPITLEFTENITTSQIDLSAGDIFPSLNFNGYEQQIPQLSANLGIFNFYIDAEKNSNQNNCASKSGSYRDLQDHLHNYFTLDGRPPASSSSNPDNIASFDLEFTNNTDRLNAELVFYIANYGDNNPRRYSCAGIFCNLRRYYCWISVNSKLIISADNLKRLSKSGDYTFSGTLNIQ